MPFLAASGNKSATADDLGVRAGGLGGFEEILPRAAAAPAQADDHRPDGLVVLAAEDRGEARRSRRRRREEGGTLKELAA